MTEEPFATEMEDVSKRIKALLSDFERRDRNLAERMHRGVEKRVAEIKKTAERDTDFAAYMVGTAILVPLELIMQIEDRLSEAKKLKEERDSQRHEWEHMSPAEKAWTRAGGLERAGRKEDALRAYDEAIHLNSTETRYRFDKTCLLSRMGLYGAVVKECDDWVNVDPKDSFAHEYKGDALMMLGRRAEAEKEYSEWEQYCGLTEEGKRVEKANRKYQDTWTWAKGPENLDGALASISAAVELAPDEARYRFERGRILHKVGKRDGKSELLTEALAELVKASELNEWYRATDKWGDPEFHKTMALVLQSLGRKEQSDEELLTAERIQLAKTG